MGWKSVGIMEFDGEYPILMHDNKKIDFYAQDIEDAQQLTEGARIAFEANSSNMILDYEELKFT